MCFFFLLFPPSPGPLSVNSVDLLAVWRGKSQYCTAGRGVAGTRNSGRNDPFGLWVKAIVFSILRGVNVSLGSEMASRPL